MKALSLSWKVLNGLYRSLVVLFYFNWFIAPSFNINELTFWVVYVVMLTIKIVQLNPDVMSVHYKKKNEDNNYWFVEELKGNYALSIMLSFIFLLGYIVKLVVGI